MIDVKKLIQFDELEAVKKYYSKGCEVNKVFDNSETALHWACEFLRPDVVELLLTIGADPHMKTNTGADAKAVTLWFGESAVGYTSDECTTILQLLNRADELRY